MPELDLTDLNVSGCGSVTHQGVVSLLGSNKNLASLNLSLCRRVFSGLPATTTQVFKAIAKVSSLSLCQLSIANFSSARHVTGIERLEINGLDSPGSEIVDGLAGLDTSHLTMLKARFLGAPCQVSLTIFTYFIKEHFRLFLLLRRSF